MTIAAHQPNFLPNLAFFNKLKLADKFIIIGNVQFEKQEGWQQRHKIPGPNSDIWLTVPVLGSQNQLIRDVKINNSIKWNKKHSKTLQLSYSKTQEKDFLSDLLKVYEKQWDRLIDLNTTVIQLMSQALDIETPVVTDELVSGKKHTLLINICKKYNADTYLSGLGASTYLTEQRLSEVNKNGLKHVYVEKNLTQEYPYSTVHYILSKGIDWVKEKIS